MKRTFLTIIFLLVAQSALAVEVLVIGTADNITGHEVGMRNTILSESGLPSANVKICYTGASDAAGHDPAIHIRVNGLWPNACIDYAANNSYELISVSYTGFSSTIDSYIASKFRTNKIGAVYATTSDIAEPRLFYTTTPGREYPDDTAGSTASNYLELLTYDAGSLSNATAKTSGILAYLLANTSLNYWDARAAIRINSSQYPTWNKNIGFGYLNIVAAKAVTNPATIALQSPLITSIIPTDVGTVSDVAINFEHFAQTRWDSTKIVYFTSVPTPGVSGPADAAGTICDVALATTTSCTWSAVPNGTYWIAAFTEQTTSYSALIDGLSYRQITVNAGTAPVTRYMDNTNNSVVQDGLSWETAWTGMNQFNNIVSGDSIYIKATDKFYARQASTPSLTGIAIYGDATGVGTTRGLRHAKFTPSQELYLANFTWDGVNSVYTRAETGIARVWIEYLDKTIYESTRLVGLDNAAAVYAAAAPAYTSNVTDGFILKLGSISSERIRIWADDAAFGPLGNNFENKYYGIDFYFSINYPSLAYADSIAEDCDFYFARLPALSNVSGTSTINRFEAFGPDGGIYFISANALDATVTISNGIIANSYARGMRANTSDPDFILTNIRNLTITGSTFEGILGPIGTQSVSIKNTISYGNGSTDISLGATVVKNNSNNLYGTQLNYTGTNDVVGTDPLFVSTTDFRLQATSPAIDAGVDVGLTTDITGAKVPYGTAPDIGAYEYIKHKKRFWWWRW